jgi:murein L,D-transpeptidase YcbB/YkuD
VLWPIAAELIDGTINEQRRWALSVAQVLGEQPNLSLAELTTWIKQFQRQNGLRADGIIGSETQMALALKAYNGPELKHNTENANVIHY